MGFWVQWFLCMTSALALMLFGGMVPTNYKNSMHLFVEDTCFQPEYTPTERQGKLIDWAQFAIQFNPYLVLNSLDGTCKTVEVVLVRRSSYVTPYSGLTLSTMES